MAQRFGGRFSPGAKPGAPPPAPVLAPPLRGRARVHILAALAGLPVLAAFFSDGALALAITLLAGGAIFAGAVATREGLKAEAAWEARKVARRPAVPRKLFGAVLVGAGVMLGAMDGLSGILSGITYGVVAVALHILSFGMDPMRDKGIEGVDAHQSDRVARTIDEAEGHLAAMRDAVLRARDRDAESRVARVAAAAREMFRAVEESPRELTAARRYLGVYLMGARDATEKFADLYGRTRDATVKTDYLALLDDLERGMEAKRETLLISDRTDLDVEIEVLRDRLKRDGLPVGE
jgi:5-bromo-4-chloroindolyl phosphate hydrolysis protein